ncbi:MAG TPA: precorrin-6y C5,15-methyltransferase (decarboxylating) subunit CbiE [Clostridia bacterium]|nr:precorrin-6y C5,15-methyltransferase (decarboxylating) subunit CbiE [Clostridia bacterium]
MIRLVGVGPGSMKHITVEAIDRIKAADRVVAFGRIAATAKEIRTDIQVVDKVDEVSGTLDGEADTAILASGDPCFYGILDFLQKQGVYIDEVVPGLSSIQYMMAKLKKSWQSAALISFHGREAGIQSIKEHKTAVILTDSKYTPGYISGCLRDKGVKGKIYAGFNLSYDDEHIVEKRIGEEIGDISPLALVVIENEMD